MLSEVPGFHLYSLIRWELDVVMARLFMRRDRADKGDDPLVTPTQISISPGVRCKPLGYSSAFPLSFQDAASKSLLPEPLRNLDGSIVQPNIRLLLHLALHHPLQKQVLAHPHLSRWQLLDAIKENTHQTLLLGNTI